MTRVFWFPGLRTDGIRFLIARPIQDGFTIYYLDDSHCYMVGQRVERISTSGFYSWRASWHSTWPELVYLALDQGL